jgi:HEAT repeat protein
VVARIAAVLAQDADEQVRTSAAESLGHLGDKQGVEPLIAALKDRNNYVRTAAAAALGLLGPANAALPLIETLKDSDRLVRSAAAEALGHTNDVRAVRPLIEALGDPDQFVRTNAAYALGKLGDRQAVEPLMDAVHLDDNRIKNRAIDSLGAIGDARSLPVLIDALKDKDRFTRGNAAGALAKIGDKSAVEPLIQALSDPDGFTRRSAVDALSHLGDERAFEPIASLIKNDQDQTVKASAISALAKVGGARAVDPLMEILREKSPEARNNAAIALGQLHKPEALNALLALMAGVDMGSINDLRPPVTLFFKEAGADARAQLKVLLTDGDLTQRQRALLLTTILDDQNSFESLLAALKDSNGEQRALAVLLLGRAHDLRAATALRGALADRDADVRARASEALAQLGLPKYEPPILGNGASSTSSASLPTRARNDNSLINATIAANQLKSKPPKPLPAAPPRSPQPAQEESVSLNNRGSNFDISAQSQINQSAPQPPAQPSVPPSVPPSAQPSTQPSGQQVQPAPTAESVRELIEKRKRELGNVRNEIARNNAPEREQKAEEKNSPLSQEKVDERKSDDDDLKNAEAAKVEKSAPAPPLTRENASQPPAAQTAIPGKSNLPVNASAQSDRVNVESQVAKADIPKLDIPKNLPTAPTPASPIYQNETAMIAILQRVYAAEQQQAKDHENYLSLDELAEQGIIDAALAGGEGNGYELTLYISQATAKRPAKFFIIAAPINYGQSGERSFFIDETGALRANQANSLIQVGQVYGSWNAIKN